MNNGWIERNNYGELIIVELNELHFEIEHPLHPFFIKKSFEVGEKIQFQLALECERHYPINCNCLKLKTYALPILKKKTKWHEIIKKIFRK